MTTQHQQNATRWITFLNNTGEDIPSYGVFALDDLLENDTDQQTLMAAKYDPPSPVNDPAEPVDGLLGYQFSYKRVLAINGRSPVAAGKIGSCTLAYDGPAWARWNPGVDTPGEPLALDYGDQVGPHPGTFGVTALGFGFRVLQEPDTENNRVLVQQVKPETPLSLYVASQWLTPDGGPSSDTDVQTNWGFGLILNSGGLENGIGPLSNYVIRQGSLGRANCVAFKAFGLKSIIGPARDGMVIQVGWRDNYFWQTGGGCDFWAGCKVIEGALAGGEAIVDLSYSQDLPYDDSGTRTRSNYYVKASASDSTFVLPTDTICDVLYSRTDGKYYVTSVACS